MSGFHPILGLLAVAVCISYAEGAPFSAVLKDDIAAHNLHDPLPISALAAQDDSPLPRRLYNKDDNVAGKHDSQDTNVIRGRNYENNNQLTGEGTHADPTQSKARKRDSGSIREDALVGGRALREEKRSGVFQKTSRNSERREEEILRSLFGTALARSEPEEDCDEDGVSSGEKMTSTTTPESDESAPTDPANEECESEESDDSESHESPASPSQSYTSQTEDSWYTTPRTTKRPMRPRDPDRSSGSFHDKSSEGVDFSNSESRESFGRSTELD